MKRILIAGAGGQLGSVLTETFADWGDVVAHTRATLDVTDPAAVRRAIADARPSLVINCTAFNDVDGAEDRPELAFAVNAFAVRTLARQTGDARAALVHFSTDFVHDGNAREPYTEDVPPTPRSVYAMSKLTGEWFALEQPRAYVLRVESLFGMPQEWEGRRGTLDSIVAGLEQGKSVKAFTDRVVSPSYVVDVAAATRHLVDRDAAPGLYHCVNSGHGTWYQVVEEAARAMGIDAGIEAVSTDQVTLKAPRPRYCALSNGKLAAAGFRMPAWQDAVRRWVAVRGRAARVE